MDIAACFNCSPRHPRPDQLPAAALRARCSKRTPKLVETEWSISELWADVRPKRVNRVGLTLCEPLPIYLEQRTSSDRPGWSGWCAKRRHDRPSRSDPETTRPRGRGDYGCGPDKFISCSIRLFNGNAVSIQISNFPIRRLRGSRASRERLLDPIKRLMLPVLHLDPVLRAAAPVGPIRAL
jgi:hypothetical protein